MCCAWDLYINMQRSENEVVDEITIPAVYVTIADGQKLWNAGEVDVEVRACVLVCWFFRRLSISLTESTI